ncbi:MAG: hypothetical protein CME58_04045 [Halieaceae bacterium]|nr:hypothetical protein [Halieaceae bacterium]
MLTVAVIGDSLIQRIWARYLADFFEVTIFRKPESFGGAWLINPVTHLQATNNIIYAANRCEAARMDEIARFLDPDGGGLCLTESQIDVLGKYQPKKYIIGDFFSAMEALLAHPRIQVVDRVLKRVSVCKAQAILDDFIFNFVVFNENFDIHDIDIMGVQHNHSIETTISRHISIKTRDIIGTVDYTANFDNVFDRGGFLAQDKSVFVGRLRREMAEARLSELCGISEFFSKCRSPVQTLSEVHFSHTRPSGLILGKALERDARIRGSQTLTSSFIPAYIAFQHHKQRLASRISECSP